MANSKINDNNFHVERYQAHYPSKKKKRKKNVKEKLDKNKRNVEHWNALQTTGQESTDGRKILQSRPRPPPPPSPLTLGTQICVCEQQTPILIGHGLLALWGSSFSYSPLRAKSFRKNWRE